LRDARRGREPRRRGVAHALQREVLSAVHAPGRPRPKAAEEYGVWVEKNTYGKKRTGVNRSTFVIDADGNVAHAMYGVKPEGHAHKVLEALPG
jgi:peroxiredoxin